MSANERRAHLEEAIALGGTIMTARGGLTRSVPSTSTLARTPAERDAARDDIERRRQALDEEEAALLNTSGNRGDGDDSALDDDGDLSSKNVTELKELAKEQGIEGYSTMKKDDLVRALEERT